MNVTERHARLDLRLPFRHASPMKLLLTGDLHLGRTSTRLPSGQRERGRTISAWKRLVHAALDEKVHAVVLSGDVLDETNSYWEASGPFQRGIQELAAKGIRTLAVAGNHDADVLPSLANSLPPEAFTLIGTNGKWERVTLEENGSPALHIDGWSFPSRTFRQDPTQSYQARASDHLPVLGVVHGDLGATESSYAPLSLSRLQSYPVDGWLLGHLHKPSFTSGSPWVLMPGSPHPLDPGEPDLHQAWIVETKNGSLTEPRPCCPATLLYRTLELELTPSDDLSLDHLQAKIRSEVQQTTSDAFQILRVNFTGQHDHVNELTELTQHLTDWEAPDACIEKVSIDVLPSLELDALQNAGPVPSYLASALKDIPPELHSRLEQTLRTLTHQKEFNAHGLNEISLQDLPLRPLLERTLRCTLEASE